MISDPNIREQGYAYFLTEAPELLQTIEQELLSLQADRSIAKVHSLMRATHTIKGGAANVGLEVIKTVAHSLEDVLKTLYNPDLVIDAPLQTLLLQAYECLRLPLMAELTAHSIQEDEVLEQAASVFAQLQTKLGDYYGKQASIPSSVELGFDIVQSLFEIGVKQRLESIADVITNEKSATSNLDSQLNIQNYLRSQAEVFIGLAESLNLPGFKAIAETTLAALAAQPTEVVKIAEIALTDFQQGRDAILAGDRTYGGEPSVALQQLALPIDAPNELQQFHKFLTDSSNCQNQEPLPSKVADFYLKVIRLILAWFHQELGIPQEDLGFALLFSQTTSEDGIHYLRNWLQHFLTFLQDKQDSPSLCLYRQGCLLTTVLAVAQFQHFDKKIDTSPLITALKRQIRKIAKEYKKHPLVTEAEKQWVDQPRLQNLLIEETTSILAQNSNDTLLEEIWGVADLSTVDVQEAVVSLQPEVSDSNEQQITEIRPPITDKKQSIRVNLEELQHLNYLAEEMLINHNRQTLQDEQLKETIQKLFKQLQKHQQTLTKLNNPSPELPPIQNSKSPQCFDSIELEQYTPTHLLLHSALEEILQLEETTETLDQLLSQSHQTLERQQRFLANIKDDLVEVRMLPIGSILHRFSQMLQNLEATYSKPVELKLQGTHILIDKAIAEKLYDPLLHLVRNAFDHGIESPDIRHQCGKPERGVIEINTYHQGSQTIIEVRDDGKGLDVERIRQRAIEMNLLDDSVVDPLAAGDTLDGVLPQESQLLQLLFEPGFSTAQELSELSGRGIGLNIVRSQLEAMKGSIMVQSSPQKGTTFSLQLPSSLSTAKSLIVEAAGFIYALRLETIEKFLIPNPEQIELVAGEKVLCLDRKEEGSKVKVYQLSDLIYYQKSSVISQQSLAQNQETITNPVLLLRRDTELLGLEVDQVLGEQELVIRPLGSAIAPPHYICGGSVLSNGRLVLVIDGTLLIKLSKAQTYTPQTPTTAKAAFPILPSEPFTQRVLVVDDAMSVRQILTLTLQKFGYEVLQAENGKDALEQLQQGVIVGIILSDLEMPHMNGFEFLSHVRQNPALANIPVVILTSRTTEKHRQLAQELGATAYLTKPYSEQELLAVVRKAL